MTRFALSTMYAQQERFEDGATFARYAAEAGYDAIEISHSTPAAKLRQVIESNILPITAIHQPAPWEDTALGIPNCDLNLASLDGDVRQEALHYARRSIQLASEVHAAAVVLHLGHIEDDQLIHADTRLRHQQDSDRYVPGALRRGAIERRYAAAEPYRAAARSSLRSLADTAGPLGITLGVEGRINFHEIPIAAELPELLDGLDPGVVGYWHDVGHAEVLHRLGYVRRDAWFTQPGVRCVGAHVHDVIGYTDHRAPGRGDVDWAHHLPLLEHLDTWTLEVNQFEPGEAVTGAPALLSSELTRSAGRG